MINSPSIRRNYQNSICASHWWDKTLFSVSDCLNIEIRQYVLLLLVETCLRIFHNKFVSRLKSTNIFFMKRLFFHTFCLIFIIVIKNNKGVYHVLFFKHLTTEPKTTAKLISHLKKSYIWMKISVFRTEHNLFMYFASLWNFPILLSMIVGNN